VLEPLAAVLAGAHVARELVLVGSQIHGGVLPLGGIEKLRGELAAANVSMRDWLTVSPSVTATSSPTRSLSWAMPEISI